MTPVELNFSGTWHPRHVASGVPCACEPEERRMDPSRRMTNDDTLALMGSLTHIDLASFAHSMRHTNGMAKTMRYVYHELRGNVCCSSTAGRGLWYIYQAENHRWSFDKDGQGFL